MDCPGHATENARLRNFVEKKDIDWGANWHIVSMPIPEDPNSRSRLMYDMLNWCSENSIGPWHDFMCSYARMNCFEYIFAELDDAITFKLIFGGRDG